MSKLPKGWVGCKLSDICDIQYGKDLSKKEITLHKRYPVFGANSIIGYFDKYLFEDEKVLISCRGANSGKINLSPPKVFVTHNSLVLNFKDSLEENKKYFYYALKSINNADYVTGTAQPQVTIANANEILIKLAPLNEQKRIVEKLDKLLARVEESKSRLEKIPVIIKRFRQSVLNAAVTGELTKDWRERNKFFCVKDGYETPERIPFEIPDTWKWSKWIDIVSKEKHSFKRGPFGGALKKEIFVESGYKVYEQCNPINDNCDLGNYYITKDKYEELFSFRVKAFDLLISCSGVTLGRITQVPEKYKEGIINQALLKVTLNTEKISNDYFIKYFRSRTFQTYLFENAQGSAQPNIKGVKELKELPVPLPHLEEQKEIVKRVEALFKKADEIEERYKKAKAYVDKLTQSILAKAFRGELVPQNPNDPPASELLEKIKAEREKTSIKKGKKIKLKGF